MNLYDRYLDTIVSETDLPNQIDFGRYSIADEGGIYKDITNANFHTNKEKAIHQVLLLEKNKSLQDIFIDIGIDIEKSGNDNFNVIPLIRRIKNKLGLNEFEKLLYEKVFHLEEIYRVPHYLLEREIEKVHVSRAKRIPSKSYQYLASHTEDWIHKSIVSFKPSRILNEELELNFDIYENQLTVALLERCLVYLNSRLKEIQDIQSFHKMYQSLLNKDFSKGWYEKLNRNFRVMGYAYDDENYKAEDGVNDQNILTETEETLNQLSKRLLLLRKSDLFDLVNKRATQSISLRNTNVLVNHKHYRYVKKLWIELDKVKPEKGETEKIKFEQNVASGLRAYGKSLISYVLKNLLDCKLNGNYRNFAGHNLLLGSISFNETDRGVFQIGIGNQNINIVVIGNKPYLNDSLYSQLEKQNSFVFYFDQLPGTTNSRFVQINPLDPDSAERVALLFRKFLLVDYLHRLNKEYKFRQFLRDFIHHLDDKCLYFSKQNYTYRFIAYPFLQLNIADIKEAIVSDANFKSLHSRIDKENILKDIESLAIEISANAKNIIEYYLKCYNCMASLSMHSFSKFNYIKCECCGMVIKDTENEVSFSIQNDNYKDLPDTDWGMDKFTFIRSDLD